VTSSPTQLIGSAMPIVQPVHRAWGKLSWDLSETNWKSNGGTDRWQSWGGSRRHATGGEFAGRGSGQHCGDHRAAAPGWSIGDVPLRGEGGWLVWVVLGRRGADLLIVSGPTHIEAWRWMLDRAATGPRGGAGGLAMR